MLPKDKINNPEDLKAILTASEDAGSGCRYLRVEAQREIQESRAGQFFLLRVSGVTDPLLGRPFSPLRIEGRTVDFVFRVVGKGTGILASLPPGSKLELRGPCGNGFPVPCGKRLVLISGTLGIAPFLEIPGRMEGKKEVLRILGLPGRGWEEFSKWCHGRDPGLRIASQDGSIGTRGTALSEALSLISPGDEIWACGPNSMLKALQSSVIPGCERILVSLEARMACGIGGCMGCAVETIFGWKRVCVDGPVFGSREVVWDG